MGFQKNENLVIWSPMSNQKKNHAFEKFPCNAKVGCQASVNTGMLLGSRHNWFSRLVVTAPHHCCMECMDVFLLMCVMWVTLRWRLVLMKPNWWRNWRWRLTEGARWNGMATSFCKKPTEIRERLNSSGSEDLREDFPLEADRQS